MISEVGSGLLRPRAIWSGDDPSGAERALAQLRDTPIALEYPLIEDEVASRQRVALVERRAVAARARLRGWPRCWAGAPTRSPRSRSTARRSGLVHADATGGGRPLDELDAEVAASFAEGLSGVFERAVLRDTLGLHRRELQSAVQWMSGRLGQLAAEASDSDAGEPPARRSTDALTPRELEVLRLLARGLTNQAIANELVVREGTVKYHVKNILRKLGATSRADAVSRYARTEPGAQHP